MVYPPRVKLLALAAACVVLAACGLGLAAAAVPALAVASALVGVGLAAAGVVLGWRGLRPGPTLRVDARGVTDRTGLVPTGLVRWEEIAAVRKREVGRGFGAERLLELVLVDPEGFVARPGGWARRVALRYRALVGLPPVTIAGSMVSRPLGELIDEMHRWRPQLPVMELPPPLPGLFARRGGTRAPRW
mgnify:CR=1 FL=1